MITSKEKVLTLEALAEKVRMHQGQSKTVALCHGCFDILHVGHLRHFEAAKKLADILVVTVTPDRFVGKGPNRPVFPEGERAELIAGLGVIDWVAVNRWDSAIETIKTIRPSLFIKGQEYETRAMDVNPNFLKEKTAVEEIGGKIAFTYEITFSSTAAFKKLNAN